MVLHSAWMTRVCSGVGGPWWVERIEGHGLGTALIEMAAVAFLCGFYLLQVGLKVWWLCWPHDLVTCFPGGPIGW